MTIRGLMIRTGAAALICALARVSPTGIWEWSWFCLVWMLAGSYWAFIEYAIWDYNRPF